MGGVTSVATTGADETAELVTLDVIEDRLAAGLELTLEADMPVVRLETEDALIARLEFTLELDNKVVVALETLKSVGGGFCGLLPPPHRHKHLSLKLKRKKRKH